MNIIEKQSRLTFYNNKDTGFVDRQRKEGKHKSERNNMTKIYLFPSQI